MLLALSSTSGQVNVFVGSISGGLFSLSVAQGTTILASAVADVSGVDIPLVYSGTSGGGTAKLKIVSYNGATPIINVRPSTWVTTWVPQTVLTTVCNGVEDRYRFGLNGQHKDNEVAGIGNSYDYGARFYNSRLGRFISKDPLAAKFPMLTPYQFCSNNPIWMLDLDGKEGIVYTISQWKNSNGEIQENVVTSFDVGGKTEGVLFQVTNLDNHSYQERYVNDIGIHSTRSGPDGRSGFEKGIESAVNWVFAKPSRAIMDGLNNPKLGLYQGEEAWKRSEMHYTGKNGFKNSRPIMLGTVTVVGTIISAGAYGALVGSMSTGEAVWNGTTLGLNLYGSADAIVGGKGLPGATQVGYVGNVADGIDLLREANPISAINLGMLAIDQYYTRKEAREAQKKKEDKSKVESKKLP